jgi:hypothetical protein
VGPDYAREPVWMIVHDPEVKHGEVIAVNGVNPHDSR